MPVIDPFGASRRDRSGVVGADPAHHRDTARPVMDTTTEITLLGGERHRVVGDAKKVEQQILDAARGSILQLAWLTDAETAEPLGVNPGHVMTLRALSATRPGAAAAGTDPDR